MSTEIELHNPQSGLAVQMDYARAVSSGSLLPQTYRDNPANVLIAMGLGEAMGLTPAESLYRIDVIQGKPTASAELIAANVRKAGHKLRVVIDEPGVSVTATVIRADDPEFPFVVTRDEEWARKMGLLTKDNYQKQPVTMLQWRAISGVARLACPEALYGVAYTPDEVQDFRPNGSTSPLGAALQSSTGTDAAAGGSAPEGDGGAPPEPSGGEPSKATRAQVTKIAAAMTELGITDRDAALMFVNDVLPEGREVASRNELSKDEASRVIEALEADIAAPFPENKPPT